MTPDEAQSLLIGTYLALILFVWIEWRLIKEAKSPKTECEKHPSVARCRCRGNLPPGKR